MSTPDADDAPSNPARMESPAPTPERRGASTALLVTVLALLALGTFVLLFAGLFTAFVDVPDEPPLVLLVTQMTTGVVALSLALALGLVVLQGPRTVTDGRPGRPPVRLLVTAAITGLLVLAQLVAAILAGVAPLIVAGTLLGILGAATASLILGAQAGAASDARERTRAETGEPASPDLGWTRERIRRKIRVVVVTFLIALAVSGIVAVVLVVMGDDGPGELWPLVIQLSFTSAAIACVVVAFPGQHATADISRGLAPADRKAVGRRVTGKVGELAPDLEWRAARMAAAMRVTQPFLMAQTLLIFVGIVIPTFVRASEPWLLIALGAMTVFLLAMLPLLIRQLRATRRFAEETRELARAGSPAAEPRTHGV